MLSRLLHGGRLSWLMGITPVLISLVVGSALGAGIFNAILSLPLVFIPQIIRVAETVTTGVRHLDYLESARASGAGAWVIVRVHVLPNVLGPIFVYATSLISMLLQRGQRRPAFRDGRARLNGAARHGAVCMVSGAWNHRIAHDVRSP